MKDLTDFAVVAMLPIFAAPLDPLSLQVLFPDIRTRASTLLTNAREDRLRLIQAVATATEGMHWNPESRIPTTRPPRPATPFDEWLRRMRTVRT